MIMRLENEEILTCTALMIAMMPVGQKQQTVVNTAMGR